MKLKHRLLLSIAVFFCQLAQAGEPKWLYANRWVSIGTSSGGETDIQINTAKMTRLAPGVIEAWTRSVREQPREYSKVVLTLSKDKYDCGKKTIQNLTLVFYAKNGDVVDSQYTRGTVNEVIPDSIGEMSLYALCAIAQQGVI
jgi:hypothetical protein